ncbi:MAG: mevalonate kinase [Anaerolineae bacterium]
MADAPGKVILLGEHAVVYGRPALAFPVHGVRARATVEPAAEAVTLRAQDLGLEHRLGDGAADRRIHPLVDLLKRTGETLEVSLPPLTVTLRSDIPISRGLGSGAAVATALVRSLSEHLGRTLPAASISELVYGAEVAYHGTPSGIDNTVISLERPIYFAKSRPPLPVELGTPLTLVIADTGVESPTGEIVAEVRRGWRRSRARYEAIFDRIGDLTEQAVQLLARGAIEDLGEAMDANHELLIELEVSSDPINRLVTAARDSGAAGAKLSGAGRGGCVVALAGPDGGAEVAEALEEAGAVWMSVTRVGQWPSKL